MAKIFENTTALAAATLTAGQMVETKGYTTAGDGGGARYLIEAAGASFDGYVNHQLANGNVATLQCGDELDVRKAGVKADGVSDNYNALSTAITSGKKTILLPTGTIYVSDTIRILEDINLVGQGTDRQTGEIGARTIWLFPAGKTAIQLARAASPSSEYADGAHIQGIAFKGQSVSTVSTTGSIPFASKTLTLASAEDFEDGQLVLVRGAGDTASLMADHYLTAATTAGSPNVTLSNPAPTYDGMVLQIAGAGFPAGSYVVSRTATTLVMSQNAASTVTAGAITFYDDLVAMVKTGGGSTTLTLNQAATRTVTNAVVEHYDCAIYTFVYFTADTIRGINLSGAVIYTHAGSGIDDTSGRSTNANLCRFSTIIGNYVRNVLRFTGLDANACNVYSLNGSSPVDEFNVLDSSALGNYYYGSHMAGGRGYMIVGASNNTTLTSCYTEGGTYNSFGGKTMVIGGIMGSTSGLDSGGVVLTANNTTLHSSPIRLYSSTESDVKLQVGSSTDNVVMEIDASDVGGSSNLRFQRSTSAGTAQDGLWGWWPGTTWQQAGLLVSDVDSDFGSGQVAFRNGFYISDGTTNLASTNFRKQIGGAAAPTTGTWKRGDIVWNRGPSAGGFAGWICVTDGTPGTWKTFGAISV